MASKPPVWGAPTTAVSGGEDGKGFGLANAVQAGEGLGGALGHHLPAGIRRARAATRRLVKAVR